jgi:hypothetical protein
MFYQCSYCDAIFKSSVRFLKHNCKEKQRTEEVKTTTGQIAYGFYNKWVKIQYGKISNIETFMLSRYYNAFINFATFIKKIKGLADPDLFIKLMIHNNFPPIMWCNPKVYIKYITYMESTTTTIEKITITLKTLENIAEKNDCELSDVFKYICMFDLIQLIYTQKLSPWVLLPSKKFITYVMLLTEEEQIILDDTINAKIWKQIFDADPKSVKIIRKCLKQLLL